MQASVGGTRGMQKPLYRSSIRNNAYQKCLHQLEQSLFLHFCFMIRSTMFRPYTKIEHGVNPVNSTLDRVSGVKGI